MASRDDAVNAYVAECGPQHREALATLRDLVHESVPDVVETVRYKMPTFERPNGDFVCSMASRKNNVSLYCDPEAVEEHRDDLGELDVGKSCIRFKKMEDLPLDTIGRILERSGAS